MPRVNVAVVVGDAARACQWRDALRCIAPDLAVGSAEEVEDPSAVDFAVVWRSPPGALKRYRNLRAVLSLGAGVDGTLRDPDLPRGIPVVRMVDEALTEGMREYVLLHVLRYHRAEAHFMAAQAASHWAPKSTPLARERRVGIMGLGVLGRDAALHLARIGFDVKAWSRTPKRIDGIETFHGDGELHRFARVVGILVCLLPLTSQTENILNASLFSVMPHGAFLVNAARGEHLVEADLLAALASGQIAGATLDAFRSEPLPRDHPFWTHPAITVTPHVASLTRAESGARHLVAEMRRILAGEVPHHIADRAAGY